MTDVAAPPGRGHFRVGSSNLLGKKRSRRRTLVWIVIGAVALWLVVCAFLIVVGLIQAGHGMNAVRDAKQKLSASELVSQAPLVPLRAARSDFSSAEGFLHFPLLAPLEIVPVFGRQLRSVQQLSTAARRTTQIGVDVVGQVRRVLDMPHNGGPQRVATLERLSQLAGTTYSQLSAIDTGPSSALFSPLAHKRADFVNQLNDVRTKLQHAAAVARTTAALLQGPTTYLVIMANPAEMRAGSGAFLEAGVLTASAGQLHLGQVVPSPALTLAPGTVPVTGDLEARWGWLLPGVDWRNLGLTPQFDVNAALAARMWQASTGQHVDGVIAVDVQTLQQFLTVTGPVTLDGGKVVSAANVVSFLTHDQYEGLTDAEVTASPQQQARQARQDELGALAHSALSALDSESLNLKSLADAMTSSTQGRHILLWSSQANAESAWEQGGVAGKLTASSLVTAVINRGGNKLDQYLKVSASLKVKPVGQDTEATLSIDLENRTPPGQSQFIAGPYPGLGTSYGEYLGLVAVNLPAGATNVSVVGDPPVASEGREGPTWLVAVPVDLKAGSNGAVVFKLDWHSAHGSLTVMPSARLDPISWTYPGGHGTDIAPFVVTW